MKFKVGDRVKISRDLKTEGLYGRSINLYEKRQYAGMEAIIVCEDYLFLNYYHIDLDDGLYLWREEMFEPVENVNKEEFEKFIRS